MITRASGACRLSLPRAAPSEMLLKLSLLLFLSALIEAENVFEAYRRIPGRIPIIPNEILNKTLAVKNLEQCKETCSARGSLDLIFSKDVFHSTDRMACTCLPKYSWYRHGLVASQNADLYTSSLGRTIINSFLFLDSAPIPDSRLHTVHLTKASVEDCALTCLHYKGRYPCLAFLFDIISRECLLYSKAHIVRIGGFEEEKFVNGVNKLYFEKLSPFELYFIPMPRTRLADGAAPDVKSGQTLQTCSKLCVFQQDCLAFNYIPKDLSCELLIQTHRDIVNMKDDPDSIHFEMIPSTECGRGRSDAKFDIIRSPGWPYQLSKKFMEKNTCKWDILTPWGLTVKLDYKYFNLEHSGDKCFQSVQIGAQTPKCVSTSQQYKQTSEVTTFNLTVKNWPRPANDLKERVGFLMSYTLDWAVDSQMRDTGVIACPGFPKAMEPTITSWDIITNTPNQKVLIEFQAFDMTDQHATADKGFLKFIQNGKVMKYCHGAKLEPNCEKTMTFNGNVKLCFNSGFYSKGEFPPGFKLIYTVGHIRSMSDFIGTDLKTMNEENLVVNETNLQTRYKSVNRTIIIKNPDKNGKIELRILKLHLSGTDEANDCSQDSLRVVDPYSKDVNFTFCGQTAPPETITSFKNELYIIVKVDALPYTDKFKPERTFVIQATKKTVTSQELVNVEEETSIELTERKYLPNKHIKWIIRGSEVLEPRLTFRYAHLAEYKYLEQRFCDNDRLLIKHGPGVITSCGYNQSLSNKALYTNDNEIDITFKSDDIISGVGFVADVEMISTSRCKPGEVLKVTANETDFLMSENYPGVQNSRSPCSWQLMAENSTGVFVTVLEGEMFLSTEEPSEEKTMQQANKKSLHLPTDTILSWSGGGTKGKFLATIRHLDLTTTAAPTTTEPTTSTSIPEVTTKAPTTTTSIPEVTTKAPTPPPTISTSTVLPPDFGKQQQDKGSAGPKIGAGVGAAVLLFIVLALIIWKVHDTRRVEKIEPPGEFVNSGYFQRPDEVIKNYGHQTSFDNPAYVEHPPSINNFDSADDSEYVMMEVEDRDHREFSHLSSNMNSLYGTSNPYEE